MEHTFDSAAELPWHPQKPGRFIKADILDMFGLSQQALADRLGVTRRTINELVVGKRSISIEMATRLSKLTGQSAEYWLNLQTQYDLWSFQQSGNDSVKIVPLQALEQDSN